MAGIGAPPKPKEQRRTRHEPRRGEWVDLPPLEKPVLPELPGGEWDDDVRELWEAWRADPVTAEYASADIAFAIETIRGRQRKPDAQAEFRLRCDHLGLTPKGKRDLRWRITEKAEKPQARKRSQKASDRRARLSVVK